MFKSTFLHLAFTAGLMLASSSAFAQGTASGPSTSHVVDLGGDEVWIGGINDPVYGPDPFPIDLDPDGLPWVKDVHNPPTGSFPGGAMTLHETILNAGTEPWHDWHEIAFSGGTLGSDWDAVLDLRVNGSSITFDSTIAGGLLTLDNFSQPVLPGEVLEIDKTLVLTGTFAGASELLFRIAEFPTTDVPEPTTAMLLLLGVVGGVSLRSRKS